MTIRSIKWRQKNKIRKNPMETNPSRQKKTYRKFNIPNLQSRHIFLADTSGPASVRFTVDSSSSGRENVVGSGAAGGGVNNGTSYW